MKRLFQRAFSLLELLVVVSIMLILISLSTVAVQHVMRGVELTSSAATVQDILNLARQTALSTNCPVEVRFYQVPPKDGPASSAVYRAIGIYQVDQNGPRAVGKLSYLDGTMRLADTEAFGTLLKHTPEAKSTLRSLDATGTKEYVYHYFQYRPDGSTSLDANAPAPDGGDTWHVMIYGGNDSIAGGTPPANYASIQLDPVTGRTEMFRPGR